MHTLTPYRPCLSCAKSIQGPFVRALGSVYHLECFTCLVRPLLSCPRTPLMRTLGLRRSRRVKVLSHRFPQRQASPTLRARLFPPSQSHLCKMRHGIARKLHHRLQCVYFSNQFFTPHLRADKKFHVEHFTCSLCPTLFGPQDSYYEHDGDVYCHFHYSTRFATKCAGCHSAILKQFVEINRNMKDECWHPECYMINKVRF